jgi:hypothetical protein
MKSQKKSMELFDDSKLGICHILSTVAVRRMNHKGNYERMTNICFTVPAYCIIDITVMREANIRLYGTTIHSGVKIKWNNPKTVTSSTKTAKIMQLVYRWMLGYSSQTHILLKFINVRLGWYHRLKNRNHLITNSLKATTKLSSDYYYGTFHNF